MVTRVLQLILFVPVMFNIQTLWGQNANFTMHPVDLNIPGIHCVKVFDLDQDGDPDIIGGSEHTPYSASVGLLWWRNDGGEPVHWTRFLIDSSFLHVMSVEVNDVDGDGFPDVVASSWENGRITWWRNSGDPMQGWTATDIASGWINPHDAACFDIDANGDMDVIGVSSGNNRISVFYNQGGSVPSFQEQMVTSDFYGAKTVLIRDLDNDGLPDLVGAGDVCDDIAWWKNMGGVPVNWSKRFITTYFNGAAGLDAEDMNNDNQVDIIGTGWKGNEVSFWICNDIGTNSWTKTMLTDQLEIAVGAIGRDFDLDGNKDIVSVGKMPGELVIFYREGDIFTEDILFPGFEGGSALAVFDLDQDGDDDIIAGAGVLKELYWFENMTINLSAGDVTERTDRVNVFPNPSSGRFTVCMPGIEQAKVCMQFYDLSAKKIYFPFFTKDKNQMNIHVPNLRNGCYLLEITTGDSTYTKKIVIDHSETTEDK